MCLKELERPMVSRERPFGAKDDFQVAIIEGFEIRRYLGIGKPRKAGPKC